MTTIAFKGDILAADTQLTVGDVKVISSDKILKLNAKTILAAAGDLSAIDAAKQFFQQENWESKLNEKPKVKGKLDAILIYEGAAYTTDKTLILEPIEHPYWAVGSGWEFAMAGMHLGMGAIQAVKFASEFDINTNSKIRYLNVKDFYSINAKTKSGGRSKRKEATPLVEVEEEGSGAKEI